MINEYLETLGKYIRYKKEYIGNDTYRLYIKKNEIELLENYLTKLEQIDNANPSEALDCIEKVNGYINNVYDYEEVIEAVQKDINTVKQSLLKAQEQEKVLEILKPYLRLSGKYLQARMPLVDNDSWINIKEITDEEEFDLLKRYFENE